jgi:hypothetical protein
MGTSLKNCTLVNIGIDVVRLCYTKVGIITEQQDQTSSWYMYQDFIISNCMSKNTLFHSG